MTQREEQKNQKSSLQTLPNLKKDSMERKTNEAQLIRAHIESPQNSKFFPWRLMALISPKIWNRAHLLLHGLRGGNAGNSEKHHPRFSARTLLFIVHDSFDNFEFGLKMDFGKNGTPSISLWGSKTGFSPVSGINLGYEYYLEGSLRTCEAHKIKFSAGSEKIKLEKCEHTYYGMLIKESIKKKKREDSLIFLEGQRQISYQKLVISICMPRGRARLNFLVRVTGGSKAERIQKTTTTIATMMINDDFHVIN
uniref:Uncharacterized protein n=1 Tax=Glossina pallidipes TaxID=7398 RepID=A0A1A9ZQY6_GLOPL